MIRALGTARPVVDPSAFIDLSAQVIGDVVVGRESSIWLNAVVRGDLNLIRIGDRSNIQDGCIVHVVPDTDPTTIGSDTTIGHGAIVHGCKVESRCLIGMGAILLNGCRIGTGSIVAAGALVSEGMDIPPGSMVMGVPATIRRSVTTDEKIAISGYAERYVQYRLRYMVEQAIG
jgi:carbonic anhydrase/acetyltransferase-like protein (isoleucine patch superfamily)